MRLVSKFFQSRSSQSAAALFHSTTSWRCEVSSAEPSPSSPPWYELPPVPPQVPSPWQGDLAGKELTALRWVARCCPGVPYSLLHRLFRKRQVRMRTEEVPKPRRVSEGEALAEGAVLCLPASLAKGASADKAKVQHQAQIGEAEVRWLQSLVLHKDEEVLVINKPAGMAVQGGTNVGKSLDSVMGEALSFERTEGPRLVHRLDKDTSGVLILGRTSESTAVLHALFREKTADAEAGELRSIERRYWALVMGSPRQRTGRISAPLVRVVLDKGWSDRIVVADHPDGEGVQSAVTDYTVLGPSLRGCTWLELRPLTGRKHQLRVHCAEVLGMPIVGDYRYGWKTHKNWPSHDHDSEPRQAPPAMRHKGDVLSDSPWLHLHCRETIIPNVAAILKGVTGKSRSQRPKMQFLAPLPPHMEASWDVKGEHVSDDRIRFEDSHNFYR